MSTSAALARSDGALVRALSEVNASLALLHDQVGTPSPGLGRAQGVCEP